MVCLHVCNVHSIILNTVGTTCMLIQWPRIKLLNSNTCNPRVNLMYFFQFLSILGELNSKTITTSIHMGADCTFTVIIDYEYGFYSGTDIIPGQEYKSITRPKACIHILLIAHIYRSTVI